MLILRGVHMNDEFSAHARSINIQTIIIIIIIVKLLVTRCNKKLSICYQKKKKVGQIEIL